MANRAVPSLLGQMEIGRITVEQKVGFSDLDLSKEADVDIMRQRLREAAVQGCKEVNRRFKIRIASRIPWPARWQGWMESWQSRPPAD